MVSEKVQRKHARRKERVRNVYSLIEAEAAKARPNFGRVAVKVLTDKLASRADMYRAFDAAAYVTEVFDPNDFSKVHRALEKAGFEK